MGRVVLGGRWSSCSTSDTYQAGSVVDIYAAIIFTDQLFIEKGKFREASSSKRAWLQRPAVRHCVKSVSKIEVSLGDQGGLQTGGRKDCRNSRGMGDTRRTESANQGLQSPRW